ncbi:nucleotidyltransferase domain-containing protein [Duganella sp. P38]|uniref:nucleotidyltransferase domain-containing protein n=1 Tax=Duganella sp. P38 TaxID=3423949 RepID=UPI003D7B6C90
MRPALLDVLRQPAALAACTLAEADLVLRQAESAGLLATLHARCAAAGLLPRLAAPVHARLESAWRQAERHSQAVRWEVRQIRAALAGLEVPLILLKGAAYSMAGLQAAEGRLFSDIDILVPKARLADVEAALMLHGWADVGHDEYDQQYYRRWMHELPPLRHIWRDTVIDVHHAILPETAAARPDAAALRREARVLPGWEAQGPLPALLVLAPNDMVLHSATHLLYESEFGHGLRGLVDLDRLLHQHAAEPGFWPALTARARQLQLGRPLFYALRRAARLLGTPVPASAFAELERPAAPLLAVMDQLLGRALLPQHASSGGALHALSRQLLYLRGNWLRMPPWLLARHLCHKAVLTPLQAARARSQ